MKIGVFVCHCGFNIAGTINIPRVLEHFSGRPDLYVTDSKYLCAESGVKDLVKAIEEQKLDRIVIAACTFKMHGRMFRDEIEKAGIHRDLVAFANIREQNSWVHGKEPELATEKAIEQIEAAIHYVKLLEPADRLKVPITPTALVIGGGIAGIHGALAIADAGYKVILVEKDSTIGGHMALFDKTFPTLDCSICILGPIMNEVNHHPNIELLTYSEVESVSGYIGNFEVTIRKKARYVDEEKCVGCFEICSGVCPITLPDRFFPRKAIDVKFSQAVPLIPVINNEYCTGCGACEIACDRGAINYNDTDKLLKYKVGAVLVATGFKDFDPTGLREYGYGVNPDVITGLEMERMLNPDGPTDGKIITPSTGKPPSKVAFVLCVGSRNKNIGKEYCSAVCCLYSIKHAILLKERVPGVDAAVFYTDIRANFKGGEEFYNRAREEFGIRFIKGAVSSVRRKTSEEGPCIVYAENELGGGLIKEEFDLVVLATGQEPPVDLPKISQMLNISTDPNGFLLESHLKIRPSRTTLEGVFLAGAVQGPKDIPTSILQAESAASKIIDLLGKKELVVEAIKVKLDPEKCDLCRLCLNICDFNALKIENNKLILNSANCRGCGACTSMCHTGALYIPGFTNEQITAQIDTYLSYKKHKPLIIGFLCNWCGYAGADLAGTSKIQYPTNIRIIRVMCSAMVNPEWVVRALLGGADGVVVAGCYEQDCHYNTGFTKAKERVDALKEMLDEVGIDPRRFRLISVSAGEGRKFADEVTEFANFLARLGNKNK